MASQILGIQRYGERAIHVFLILVLACISIVLEQPGDLVTSPIAAGMRMIGPEAQWAYALATISMIGVSGILAHRPLWERFSIFMLATAHGTISVCAFRAVKPGSELFTTSTTTYALIAGLGYFLFWLRTFRA